MRERLLGRLGSGELVYACLWSHIHSGVERLLPNTLAVINSMGRRSSRLTEEVDFGQIVGRTICVITFPEDEIVFAKRIGRAKYTRFVKGRLPELCSRVTVILQWNAVNNCYDLVTAYIGYKEGNPWVRYQGVRTFIWFWDWHALIWEQADVIPGTEMSVCPLEFLHRNRYPM